MVLQSAWTRDCDPDLFVFDGYTCPIDEITGPYTDVDNSIHMGSVGAATKFGNGKAKIPFEVGIGKDDQGYLYGARADFSEAVGWLRLQMQAVFHQTKAWNATIGAGSKPRALDQGKVQWGAKLLLGGGEEGSLARLDEDQVVAETAIQIGPVVADCLWKGSWTLQGGFHPWGPKQICFSTLVDTNLGALRVGWKLQPRGSLGAMGCQYEGDGEQLSHFLRNAGVKHVTATGITVGGHSSFWKAGAVLDFEQFSFGGKVQQTLHTNETLWSTGIGFPILQKDGKEVEGKVRVGSGNQLGCALTWSTPASTVSAAVDLDSLCPRTLGVQVSFRD